MLAENRLDSGRYRDLNIHIVGLYDHDADFGAASKINAEWAFLEYLFDRGRSAASEWLETNFDAIGKRSTVDIRRMFEGDGYEIGIKP